MGSEVLEVIKLRDIVRITNVPGLVPGLFPPTLELRGEDFSSAAIVIVSGIEVSEFVIVDRFTIYAQMPPNLSSVHSIEVLSSNFTKVAQASRIEFRIGTRPKSVKGLLKLSQHFLMWLLKDPISDAFTPGQGGGLQQIAATIVHSGNALQLRSSVSKSVSATSDQIRRAQASVRNLPLDEKLLSAEILSIGQQSADEVRVRLRLISMAGPDIIPQFRL